MAKDNLAACLTYSLAEEGGYADNPRDPGGATNMGITIGTLSDVRGYRVSKDEVKALSLDEATAIYRDRYWNALRCEAIPFGLDLAVLDYGINSGASQAARDLQRTVGAGVDGIVGPDTLKRAVLAGTKEAIKGICARRLSLLRGLKTWETFKRGWSARVARIEAAAVAMWLAKGGALTDADRKALQDEADAAGKASAASKRGSQGAGGGMAAGGIADWLSGAHAWVLGVVVVVGVLVIIGLAVKARHHAQRADAYRAAAS